MAFNTTPHPAFPETTESISSSTEMEAFDLLPIEIRTALNYGPFNFTATACASRFGVIAILKRQTRNAAHDWRPFRGDPRPWL
jgi:hypothetical protein